LVGEGVEEFERLEQQLGAAVDVRLGIFGPPSQPRPRSARTYGPSASRVVFLLRETRNPGAINAE